MFERFSERTGQVVVIASDEPEELREIVQEIEALGVPVPRCRREHP